MIYQFLTIVPALVTPTTVQLYVDRETCSIMAEAQMKRTGVPAYCVEYQMPGSYQPNKGKGNKHGIHM